MPTKTLMAIALLALSIVCAGTAARAGALPQATVRGADGGYISFGSYRPREPKRLGELPLKIRRKVQAYLVERLGAAFAARLTFAGGQIVDIDELYRVEPSAHDYHWTISSYNLFFAFSIPERGIAEFTAAIELDRNGDVIEDIALPPMRRQPQKQNFISLQRAYETAAGAGFDPRHTSAEIRYERAVESLVYRLRQRTSRRMILGNSRGETYKTIDIDAHSAAILRFDDEFWYH